MLYDLQKSGWFSLTGSGCFRTLIVLWGLLKLCMLIGFWWRLHELGQVTRYMSKSFIFLCCFLQESPPAGIQEFCTGFELSPAEFELLYYLFPNLLFPFGYLNYGFVTILLSLIIPFCIYVLLTFDIPNDSSLLPVDIDGNCFTCIHRQGPTMSMHQFWIRASMLHSV